MISVPLDGGETGYLATTIFDESLTSDDFKELYFMRWPIESKYEELKKSVPIGRIFRRYQYIHRAGVLY